MLDTLAHFVKDDEGPPPGIPRHAGELFERSLADQCINQRLSPILTGSLARLALPPELSRITRARLDEQCRQIARAANQRLALLGQVCRRMENNRLPHLVMGDASAALSLYPHPELRPVPQLELLVEETARDDTLRLLATMGFRPPYAYPPMTSGSEALRYHQFFEPLILANDDHQLLRLRFRLVDYGPAEPGEPAWDRSVPHRISNKDIRLVSREDQLVHSLVRFQTSRFRSLLDALDVGFVLARSATLDWACIHERLRAKRLSAAAYLGLNHVCRLFGLPAVTDELPHPDALSRRVFGLLWERDRREYAEPLPQRDGVLSCYLWAAQGLWTKARVLWRCFTPEASWLVSFYGDPRRWWHRLLLYRDVHTRRRHVLRSQEAKGPATGARVTRFPGAEKSH